QDGAALARPEPLLEAHQPLEAVCQLLVRRVLRVAVGVGRIDLREADLGAGLDPECLEQCSGCLVCGQDQASATRIEVMLTGWSGRSCEPVRALAIASTTSSPAVSFPKIV